MGRISIDGLVKSQKVGFSVIPAKAGIQFFPPVISFLDSGFHRSDDFLRDHQYYLTRLGQKVVTTALKLKTLFIIPSLAEPIKMTA